MPGDIKFVISGDATAYEKELDRVNALVEEVKSRVDNLYKELKLKDDATDIMVKETVDTSKIELSNVRASIEVESDSLDELEIKRQQTERRVQFTVSGMLIGLRAVTDVAALASVVTGEQVDVAFLNMISMGVSAALQIQVMAAAYAVTPGMAPIALMLLAMIPVLTGMITYIKSEQMKAEARSQKGMESQFDKIIDGLGI